MRLEIWDIIALSRRVYIQRSWVIRNEHNIIHEQVFTLVWSFGLNWSSFEPIAYNTREPGARFIFPTGNYAHLICFHFPVVILGNRFPCELGVCSRCSSDTVQFDFSLVFLCMLMRLRVTYEGENGGGTVIGHRPQTERNPHKLRGLSFVATLLEFRP